MSDQWNTTTVDPSQAPEPLTDQQLAENLGHTSQFVGLMDTEDKVRGHLDAVAQYQAVRYNLLHNGEFSPEEIKRAYCSEWVSCDACESPHGACVDVCAKKAKVESVATFGLGAEIDNALAEDFKNLVALGAYDEPAPAVSAQRDYQQPAIAYTEHLHRVAAVTSMDAVAAAVGDPVELARLQWKGAVAKRNALMAQWDAYVAECRAYYQQLKRNSGK